jgi:hypothetical protein
MLIDVCITRAEVIALLGQVAPIRIHLTETDEDRRWIEFEPPSSVEFVAGQGVRITAHGRLRYELLGVRIPGTIRSVQLLLCPKLDTDDEGRRTLAFDIEIEDGDLSGVPGFIDGAIVQKVNAATTPRTTGMVWHFGRTFNFRAGMPSRLEPLDAFLAEVENATVQVDEGHVRLRIQLAASFTRSKPRPTDDEHPAAAAYEPQHSEAL